MKQEANLRISFEFFPPKTEEGRELLVGTAAALAETSPDFFSVTFGAGGSTREGTFETVKLLQQKTAVSIAPHLSCMGLHRDEIIETLRAYQERGVRRLVALRGDLPVGSVEPGGFRYASELIELVRETTQDHFHIEIAAYPECHPEASNARQDLLHFKKKVEAGANSAITQYFFNADAYFYFLDACSSLGISIPIFPGIMPIHHLDKLLRFSERCGAEIPRFLRKRFESFQDDQEAIYQFGIEIVHDLCEQLLAGGAPGLHFYTLNQAETSLEIFKLLHLSEEISNIQPLFAVGQNK